MNIVLSFSLMLFCGFIVGKLLKRLGLPSVTGYIITGIIFGESVLGLQTYEQVHRLKPITNLGLGIIALVIGEELIIKEIKELGLVIFNITLFQALGTILIVILTLLLIGVSLPLAVILGVIASATAPAATTAVIEEYDAKGPYTRTLLATIAIDDAICIIIFGAALAIVQGIIDGGGLILVMFREPFIEIIGSLTTGLLLAWLLFHLGKYIKKKGDYLVIVVSILLLDMELARLFQLSPLLVNMMVGFSFVNFFNSRHELREIVKIIKEPIYVAFFTLAGAKLHLNVLLQTGIIGIIFIISRIAGKLGGAWLGALISGASKKIRRYVGLGLIPQAGVAVGLVFIATEAFPQFSEIITSVVLASITVSELIGPLAVKIALAKVGEINTN